MLIKKLMKHLGLNDAPCSIYSVLAISEKPLTVREISEKTGYSLPMVYSSIKELVSNNLVEKIKIDSFNYYSANINFIDVFENRRKKLMEEFLEPLSNLDVNKYSKNIRIREIRDYAREIYRYFSEINNLRKGVKKP